MTNGRICVDIELVLICFGRRHVGGCPSRRGGISPRAITLTREYVFQRSKSVPVCSRPLAQKTPKRLLPEAARPVATMAATTRVSAMARLRRKLRMSSLLPHHKPSLHKRQRPPDRECGTPTGSTTSNAKMTPRHPRAAPKKVGRRAIHHSTAGESSKSVMQTPPSVKGHTKANVVIARAIDEVIPGNHERRTHRKAIIAPTPVIANQVA